MFENINDVITELKQTYKSLYLIEVYNYRTSKLATGEVVIRPLTRGEFNFFSSQNLKFSHSQIINKCVLYPLNLDENDWLAGIDEYIYNSIIQISGFSSEEELVDKIEKYRKYATSLEAIMTMYICKAFPSYKPKDIDTMNLEEIVYLASLSEQILSSEIPYLNILHPELIKEQKQKNKKPIPEPILKKSNMPRYNNPNLKGQIEDSYSESYVTKDNFEENMKKLNSLLNG